MPNVPSLVFLALCTIFVAGCTGSYSPSPHSASLRPSTERTAGKLDARPHFNSIFADADEVGVRKGNSWDVSGPAEQFVKGCCESKAKVVELFARNGFEIYPDRQDSDRPDIDQPYDQRIIAEKRAEQFLYFWKIYRVAAYIKDDYVVATRAYVFQHGI